MAVFEYARVPMSRTFLRTSYTLRLSCIQHNRAGELSYIGTMYLFPTKIMGRAHVHHEKSHRSRPDELCKSRISDSYYDSRPPSLRIIMNFTPKDAHSYALQHILFLNVWGHLRGKSLGSS